MNRALVRIAPQVAWVPDTLRAGVKQTHIDAGQQRGTSTAAAAPIREQEREVRPTALFTTRETTR